MKKHVDMQRVLDQESGAHGFSPHWVTLRKSCSLLWSQMLRRWHYMID